MMQDHDSRPRFVILRHEPGPGSDGPSHWDLMFEVGGTLRTWSSEQLPSEVASPACALADHRIEYLQYEGPISRQRGSVSRWDEGRYEVLEASPQRWIVQLHGLRLSGRMELVQATANAWEVRLAARPPSGRVEGE